jgi:hypothetical protein
VDQTPPTDDPPPLPPTAPATSLAARLLNVFAAPGEVFEEVKASSASVANWLAPTLIGAVIGTVGAFIIFSQPAIVQKIHEQQEQMFEQQVKAGKMSQADADRALAMAEKFSGPTVLKILGVLGAVVGSFVRLLWWGLVVWLLGRWFLKAQFGYVKALEVAGLSSMIAVLGGIVTLLLIVNFGKLTSSPSLALAISDFDVKNKAHLLAGAVNVFNFWLVGVMASGLARLAGVPFLRAATVVLGYWLVTELLVIFTGLRAMGF